MAPAHQPPPGKLHCRSLDVWLASDGIARIQVTRPSLDGSDAEELLAALAQLSDQPQPLIADIRALRSITLSLRRVMASPQAGARISRAAVVVSNPVNRMIGSFFLRLNHPPFDMQLFEGEQGALHWLAKAGA
jgi:hypothetical protein